MEKADKVKVRIVKVHEMYYGEVYGIWRNILGAFTGWNRVTPPCFTKLGAKVELMKWKRNNIPKEFCI